MTSIALFEDDPISAQFAQYAIENTGHQLWQHLENMPQALLAITQLEPHVNTAIVDGDLGSGIGTLDGEVIIQRLKALRPDLIAIGYTANHDGVPGADFQAGKLLANLIPILQKLPK